MPASGWLARLAECLCCRWWNEVINHPDGPPAGCKPCSRCRVRDMTDYREIMFGTCLPGDVGDPLCKPDGSCDCSKAQPPTEEECAAPAPGINSCTCWCDSNAKMRDWCKLDPDPTVFPGPCAYDRMVAQSKNEEFPLECDEQGYYKLVQCGPKAPPHLAPSPPSAQPAEAAAGDMCWCSEPSYGIQNGTSAVPKASGTGPDCVHTLQCELLNIQACGTIGAKFCNWTVIPFDNGTLCAPTMGGPTLGGASARHSR